MEQQVETKSGKILAALGRPKTAKELMDDTGLPKVTLYRYLNKLIESGQVQRLEGGYYVLAGEHPRLETVGQATKMVNEVKTLPIVDEQYFLDEKIANDYKPIKVNNIDLHDLLDWCLENNQPVILQGPTGWGKTFSVLSFAAKRRIPIVIVQASSSFILVDINADKEQAFKVVGDKAQKWLDVVMELNKLALVTHQPGIRDVIQLTKLEQEFGEKFALEVLISKYDHDEREQVKMVVKRLAKGDESEVE